MLVVLTIGWCDRESSEIMVLMHQGNKQQQQNVFHNFCAVLGNKLVSKIPNFVFGRGASPVSTPQWGIAPAPHWDLGGPWTPAI